VCVCACYIYSVCEENQYSYIGANEESAGAFLIFTSKREDDQDIMVRRDSWGTSKLFGQEAE
jgi:hypothetical protein